MAQQKAAETPDEVPEDLVDELQPGTKLLKGQYTITRYLNSGGFGITYLAKDSLDRNVVIKECFPQSVCRRSKTVVAARSRAHTAELRSVVQLFVREARNLAKIVHPNIVAVHQVFEDNGTAYMAIDYIDGLDLQQIIDGQGTMPTPEEIVVMTEKLLVAVGFIHQNDMLHRDISPDNILISRAGEPILIDFGAAREEASQKSRAMSALRVVKDGYSPQEFYIAGSEQGPWSDLYALGATLYHLISGEAPVNGQARLAALAEERADPYVPLEGRFDGYPHGFLRAIDIALNTLPRYRVQSAAEWLALFVPNPVPQGLAKPDGNLDSTVQELVRSARADAAPVEGDKTQAASYGAPPQLARKVSQAQAPVPAPAEPAKGGVGMVQLVAGVVIAAALVGAGVLFLGGEEAPAPVEPAAVAEAPAEPVTITAEVAAEPAPPTETAAAADAPAATEAPAAEAAPEPAPVTAAVSAPADTPEAAPEALAAAPVDPAFPAPAGELSANQMAFAAWDIELPFMEENRIVDNERVALVARILPSTDLAVAGDWLEPGLLIYAINGQDVQQSGSIASAILSTMSVDPDGRARVVVDFAGPDLERQTGLLTVSTTRLVSLKNGVNLEVRNIDGEWRTEVTGVTRPSATELRQGDVLFRDKSSGTAMDGPRSLEEVMAVLVEQRIPVTEFAIIRDNRLDNAAMQLAVD